MLPGQTFAHSVAGSPTMARFPAPGSADFDVVVPAPAPGPGNWVGASSAALDDDGGFVVAYRIRTAGKRGSQIVITRSGDGVGLTTVGRSSSATR